ncbi:MAG: hypothetical protein E6J65_00495 [Deltaproteobacteria bacterium]|nr:MAG: hypothetical protein E6J65_00495 [Deltaproteobacteria bacterium]
MQFKCRVCDAAVEYDPTPGLGAMPSGWRMHEIHGNILLFCDSCGRPVHFDGGLSPYMKSLLRTRGILV